MTTPDKREPTSLGGLNIAINEIGYIKLKRKADMADEMVDALIKMISSFESREELMGFEIDALQNADAILKRYRDAK